MFLGPARTEERTAQITCSKDLAWLANPSAANTSKQPHSSHVHFLGCCAHYLTKCFRGIKRACCRCRNIRPSTSKDTRHDSALAFDHSSSSISVLVPFATSLAHRSRCPLPKPSRHQATSSYGRGCTDDARRRKLEPPSARSRLVRTIFNRSPAIRCYFRHNPSAASRLTVAEMLFLLPCRFLVPVCLLF